ncbi:hypothetical protein [Pseudomonas sp. NFR16]|uniref:hypothetical protein n=1 Tax=Pseudomonas sp. NFR16 TaxID=1566248 RepID=UPI0008C79E4A|nr:hypothetical protein [Pseudomonas sp. NFR16]SEJ95388.1 hypothetical protein SAMN03159495_5480 [Pseudomonas sp. NFR16]
MKDALTAAYSNLIQNQVELASTLQSIVDEAVQRGAPEGHINQVCQRMESLASQLNALSKSLLERNDEIENCQRDKNQPGTAST